MPCSTQVCAISNGLYHIMGGHPDGFVHNQYAGDGIFYILTIHFQSSLTLSILIMTYLSEFSLKDPVLLLSSLEPRVGYHSNDRRYLLLLRRHAHRPRIVWRLEIRQSPPQALATKS